MMSMIEKLIIGTAVFCILFPVVAVIAITKIDDWRESRRAENKEDSLL